MHAREFTSVDWRAATWAGIVYTLGVFVFAFVVGAIRVTLVAPRTGALLAVLIESPIVLAVSWQVSLWCTRRFNVSSDTRACLRSNIGQTATAKHDGQHQHEERRSDRPGKTKKQ
jgi:hypothetical protein